MPRLNLKDFTEDDFEEYIDPAEDRHRTGRLRLRPKPDQSGEAGNAHPFFPVEEEVFTFSYNASLHEHEWIINSLGSFYDMKWFDDVVRLIKGGKEASVYQCAGNSTTGKEYIAAKVYRPRQFRNLRNDHLYREGRINLEEGGFEIHDSGKLHAMRNKTTYGLELLHTSWIEHEFQTLRILKQAGADIPAPFTSGNNAILMEYIGGQDMAAPTLNTVKLDQDEAYYLFLRVVHNIDLMLANNRVHGDLSAYNILYWEGTIALIDFPQAIEPERNRSAYQIFERDILRICEYFGKQGIQSRPRKLAADLWTSYRHRLTPDVHPSLLDDQDEADVTYWKWLEAQGKS